MAIKICLYCGSENDLMIDHILPISKGGDSKLSNLTRCCISCNSSKSNKTLDEFYNHIEKRRKKALDEFQYCSNIMDSINDKRYKING